MEKVLASEKGIYVERNGGYMYDSSDRAVYTNYWMLLEDDSD